MKPEIRPMRVTSFVRLRLRTAMAVLPLLAGCAATSDAESVDTSVAALDPGAFKAGLGYESLTDQPKGECVEYDNVTSVDGAGGQKVKYDLRLVQSSRELMS